jgi:hypothetical protein
MYSLHIGYGLDGVATSCGLDGRGSISGGWQEMFLYFTSARPAVGHTKPAMQWIPGVFFRGVKWPGLEADHSPPSNVEVKGAGATRPLPRLTN